MNTPTIPATDAARILALAACKPGPCPHCYSRDGHHVHCPHF